MAGTFRRVSSLARLFFAPRRSAQQKTPGAARGASAEVRCGRRRRSGAGADLAAAGALLEEQRLADHRRDVGRLERLGDQEGRLRPLAGQEALRDRR